MIGLLQSGTGSGRGRRPKAPIDRAELRTVPRGRALGPPRRAAGPGRAEGADGAPLDDAGADRVPPRAGAARCVRAVDEEPAAAREALEGAAAGFAGAAAGDAAGGAAGGAAGRLTTLTGGFTPATSGRLGTWGAGAGSSTETEGRSGVGRAEAEPPVPSATRAASTVGSARVTGSA